LAAAAAEKLPTGANRLAKPGQRAPLLLLLPLPLLLPPLVPLVLLAPVLCVLCHRPPLAVCPDMPCTGGDVAVYPTLLAPPAPPPGCIIEAWAALRLACGTCTGEQKGVLRRTQDDSLQHAVGPSEQTHCGAFSTDIQE
jgi:hypothetical protein